MSKEQVKQVENQDNCMNEAFAGALLSAQRNIRPIPWDGEDIYSRKNMELLIRECTRSLHEGCFYLKNTEFELCNDWLKSCFLLKHVPSGKNQIYRITIPICKGEWSSAHTKAMSLVLRGLLFPAFEEKTYGHGERQQSQATNCR